MEQVRFGIVGTNFISDWMVEGALQDSRFKLVAVCSREQHTADVFAARHNIPYTFTSLPDMAASPLIDAVYIASPNFLHASQSILCMNHGKHVLCEKPFASNAEEAGAMIEAANRNNVVLMEAVKSTLNPNFRVILEDIGRVGRMRRYFASYCQYSSRYDSLKAGIPTNAFNPQYSNGALMDIGIYTVYPMVVLFGMPEQVFATGTLLSSGADGQGSVIFRYGQMDAVVVYSKISDSVLPAELQGEGGSIVLDKIHKPGNVIYYPHVENKRGGIRDDIQPEDLTVVADKSEYFYEMKEFKDVVISGKSQSDINSHTNSLNTMILLDEIRRQLGVSFPADKHIVSDCGRFVSR